MHSSLLTPSLLSALPTARVGGARRSARHSLHVCASDVFARDVVSLPAAQKDLPDGETTVTLVGAGGVSVDVPCALGSYILDAGIEAGLELPYTCRAGICGACVGRVVEGEVDQSDVADLAFTLSEEEVADGMALLCMSRPLGPCRIETQSDYGYSLGVATWKGATGKIQGGKVDPLMGKKWDEIKEETGNK